jgi:hypothetical protein
MAMMNREAAQAKANRQEQIGVLKAKWGARLTTARNDYQTARMALTTATGQGVDTTSAQNDLQRYGRILRETQEQYENELDAFLGQSPRPTTGVPREPSAPDEGFSSGFSGFAAAAEGRREKAGEEKLTGVFERVIDGDPKHWKQAKKSFVAAHKDAFGAEPTVAQVKRFRDVVSPSIPSVEPILRTMEKHYLNLVQAKDRRPQDAMVDMRDEISSLRREGYEIPPELEIAMLDKVINRIPVVELRAGTQTALRENLAQQGLVTDAIDALTLPDGSIDPEVKDSIGLIKGSWTNIRRRLHGEIELSELSDKELLAMNRLEMLVEKMGRSLTGAAIQTWERDVFNRLFGSPTQSPAATVVNLKAFQKQLRREFNDTYWVDQDPERYNPDALDKSLQSVGTDFWGKEE